MKTVHFGYSAIAVLVLFGLVCNLPFASASQTPAISGGGEESLGATVAAGASLPFPKQTESSPTRQEPTPTLVPPDQCPPFDFNTDLPPLDNPQAFVGRHYDSLSLPAGLEFFSGNLLDDVHAWTRVLYSGRKVEWLERLICRDPEGRAYFTIVDAVILPTFAADQTEAGLCWLNSAPLHAVIAVGHVDLSGPVGSFFNMEGWKFDRLDYGYQIDLEIEKFVPLPIQGLECIWPNSSLEGG
jgi:hypothetical protein